MKYYKHKMGPEYYKVEPNGNYEFYYNGPYIFNKRCYNKWIKSDKPFNWHDKGLVIELTKSQLFMELL